MRKSATFVFLIIMSVALNAQVKSGTATRQRTMAGMGGIFMNYTIPFRAAIQDSVRIDSVVTLSDKKTISHTMNFDRDGKRSIALSQVLAKSQKCATCPDTSTPPFDTSKGVRVYYHYQGKKGSFRVKKFKELPELMTP